ncbi:hypothetical protein CFAM422_002750 [Trichoderma lentiforme]|uniref:Uncharacterized protein n=1 Tax=Trichoderma lentiforme TaxID=1567552 RepID=A0A9P4XL66_9HYPO|nr:hypothetical protein CFAM422_002750 [Trichoderma lentiforme]
MLSKNTCREEGDLGHFITDKSVTLGLLIRSVRHFEIRKTCYLVGRYCARNRFAHGYTKCLASCTASASASASALSSCEVKGQPYQDAHGSNHQVNRAIRVRSQHGNIVIRDACVVEIADQIIGTCENMLRDEAALGHSGDASQPHKLGRVASWRCQDCN